MGDIITGSEDYKIRTFTRDYARRDEGEGFSEYETDCKASALNANLDLDNLPSVDTMKTVKGTKEGEIKVFKSGNTAEAFMWKADT